MKRKNMISMVTSLALVGVVAVGGTLALLSAESNSVENVFTVGQGYDQNEPNPDVYLDEAIVTQEKDDSNNNLGGYKVLEGEGEGRDRDGQAYDKLVTGTTLAKDPIFHVSTSCDVPYTWIVAKVSGYNTDINKTQLSFTDVLGDDSDYAWYKVEKKGEDNYTFTEVASATDMGNGVYIYSKVLTPGGSTEPLFEQLRVGEIKLDGAGKTTSPSAITIEGYAVEGVAGATFEDVQDKVMATVDGWAFDA